MRGTNGIDIEALHRLDILLNLFCRDSTTVDRREVVTVHTMKDHTFAVNQEGTIIADTHLTEAHLTTTNINGLTFLVLQRQHQVIKVGSLGTPLLRIRHIHVKAQFCGSFHRFRRLRNGLSIFFYLHFHASSFYGTNTRKAHFHVCLRIRVSGIEVCREEVVTYLALGGCPEEAMTLNTGQSPIVLTLKE